MKKIIILITIILLISIIATPVMADKPTSPPGATITGGAFWAGSTDGYYAYSWVATYPCYYPEEKEGVSPSTANGDFGNTYGANIREFSFDGAEASKVVLQGTVTLENIGPYPETSYFEVGIGGSLNSWHQYYTSSPNAYDGSVFVVFLANNQGGYDIHVQDYATHYPGSNAVYRTTGTAGEDPVPEATFKFMVEFDLNSKLAYLTVDGVSVDPVQFGKTIWAPYGITTDEDFNVDLGIFAGMVSEDTDNTGRVNLSAIKMRIE